VTLSSKYQLVLPRESIALEAADISLAHGLAMADSLVYATARRHGATLVTPTRTSTA
jgi:predicted nucleic acid-binding protein